MKERSRRKTPAAGAPRDSTALAPAATPAHAPALSWEPWIQTLRRWFPFFGVAVAVVTGALFGAASAILVLAATALLLAISALWASLQWIAGDRTASADEVIDLALAGNELEQKQAVLRALKDLEYERSVGKISDQDYEELRLRYRAKARAVLQDLDREIAPTRREAERLVASFLASRGLTPAAPEPPAPHADAMDREQLPAPATEPQTPPLSAEARPRSCPSCSAPNDSDAAFCKKCGHRIDAPVGPQAGEEP